jgi:hypothetical protein
MPGLTLRDIHAALVTAFPPKEVYSLNLAAEAIKLEKSLAEYLVGGAQYREALLSYLEWVRAQYCLLGFLKAARAENMRNKQLGGVIDELTELETRFAAFRPVAQDGAELTLQKAEADVVQAAARFEAKVVERVGFEDVGPWLDKLANLRRAVCRIEPRPQTTDRRSLLGYGTGYLVAPEVVMTNFHVAAPFWEDLAAAKEVRVRFDFEVPAGGTDPADGKKHPLRTEWKTGEGPTPDRRYPWQCLSSPEVDLDFALLRLADEAGDGAPRPYLGLTSWEFHKPDPILILQHANAEPLKLSFGSVTEVVPVPPRVRYKVNTEGGSSGSPCLTQDLKVTAIHHFTTGDQNQAVPHHAILAFFSQEENRRRLAADGLESIIPTDPGQHESLRTQPPLPQGSPPPRPPDTPPATISVTLSREQIRDLADAIIDEFDRRSLEELLESNMQVTLDPGPLRAAVFRLIEGARDEDRLSYLFDTLEKVRPHRTRTEQAIRDLRSALGVAAAPPAMSPSVGARNFTMDPRPNPASAVEVFFSYSHRDEGLRDQLANHLALLQRQGVIQKWHDRRIGAGTEWSGQIDSHLNSARIILLLISADFLASDYCYDVEMKRAMQRHEAADARVIPIILRPCDWRTAPFGRLQALPKDARPVIQWPSADEALTHIAVALRSVAQEFAANP